MSEQTYYRCASCGNAMVPSAGTAVLLKAGRNVECPLCRQDYGHQWEPVVVLPASRAAALLRLEAALADDELATALSIEYENPFGGCDGLDAYRAALLARMEASDGK